MVNGKVFRVMSLIITTIGFFLGSVPAGITSTGEPRDEDDDDDNVLPCSQSLD